MRAFEPCNLRRKNPNARACRLNQNRLARFETGSGDQGIVRSHQCHRRSAGLYPGHRRGNTHDQSMVNFGELREGALTHRHHAITCGKSSDTFTDFDDFTGKFDTRNRVAKRRAS